MNRIQGAISISLVYAFCLFLNGCGSSIDGNETAIDDQSNSVQSAVAVAASESTASEGGAVGFATNFANGERVDPQATDIRPEAVCTYATARSGCSASTDSIAWNSCTIDNGKVILSGGWSETFSGTGAASCIVPVSSGGTVARTSTGAISTLTNSGALSGTNLTTDTNGGLAWDGTSIPSSGTSVANTAGTRTITINGTHKVLRGPKGRAWFDHFITGTLTATGTRAATNRTLTGTVNVFHQLAKYKAATTFNTVVWGSTTCCYPTSGSTSTTFTGGIAGTSSLTFSGTCGAASYTDTTGTTTAITLNQCN